MSFQIARLIYNLISFTLNFICFRQNVVAAIAGAGVMALGVSVARPPPPGCGWYMQLGLDGLKIGAFNRVICALYFIRTALIT
jgi:hypothetical protein